MARVEFRLTKNKSAALVLALVAIGCEKPSDDLISWDQSTSAIVPGLSALIVSENFPRTMSPGESIPVSVTMHNNGTEVWTSSYCLRTMGLAPSVWGVVFICVPAGQTVASDALYTFNFNITAVNTPGQVRGVWQMQRTSTGTLYGPRLDFPVDLVAGGGFDSAFVSQDFPRRVNAGQPATFSATFLNDGVRPWSTQASVVLSSINSPADQWSTIDAPLDPVPNDIVDPGQEHTFSFTVTAPATEGTYTTDWRMRQTTSAGFFGDDAFDDCIDVSDCGNGTAAYAEECDDGNTTDGDGCSATCSADPRAIDLSTAPTERTFIGPFSARQLANVALGDVTNDGVPEVMVAAMGTVPSRPVRSNAGAIYGYAGGAGFFNGTTQTVPAGVTFEVWGSDTNDRFAGGAHNGLRIGDVTGDGIDDIVASAERGDGLGNAFADAGDVYVISGGAGWNGIIDTRNSPLVVSRIYGGAARDHIQVLAIGDLTADGFNDLVIGIPGFDGDETDQGAIAIVAGGPALPAMLTLSPATATAFIHGINEGDLFGYGAGVGDISGDSVNDLVVTSAYHRSNGQAFAGAAFALFGGPFLGEYRIRDFFDVAWYGRSADDKMGSSIAVANFGGDDTMDVIIGVKAASRDLPSGPRSGTVDIWTGPFTSGSVFDLLAGGEANEPSVRILGASEGDELGDNMIAGDLNRDGKTDLAIASGYGDSPDGSMLDTGEVSITFGQWCPTPLIDMANGSALSIYGNEPSARLGLRSGSIGMGDIDNDGLIDICAGAIAGGTNGTWTDPGRVDCIRGRW